MPRTETTPRRRHPTSYLATNLPHHPDAPHATTSPHQPADLAEIIRLYGLRPWIEQSYKQIKDELGWADFQVRLRPRHPPLPDPGQLRLLLLLGPMVRRTQPPGRHRAGPLLRRGAGGGAGPCPTSPNSLTGPWPYGPSAPGSPPAVTLTRWWRAWTDRDPPSELKALIDAFTTGHGIDLYRRIRRTTVTQVELAESVNP